MVSAEDELSKALLPEGVRGILGVWGCRMNRLSGFASHGGSDKLTHHKQINSMCEQLVCSPALAKPVKRS